MNFQLKVNDEYYTPPEPIKILQDYLKPNSKILCPFDTKDSEFVKVLSKNHKVDYSHINEKDFFSYTQDMVKDYDYIISNPPFSLKTQILDQLYKLNRPFAMLLPLQTLEGKARIQNYSQYGVELLIFNKRIKFIGTDKTPPFSCVFFCKDVLKQQIEFRNL